MRDSMDYFCFIIVFDLQIECVTAWTIFAL
jgi:hypothetical protein